jgi:alkanesulfonate monooxygenase SsuD/methylene tetrahydromethanopterin reductase-like flavin-dependent oxidoreductase (luciferase family)
VVDFSGKWVKFETMRMDPKPIQKPHVPIIVGGYADAAFARAVKFGAGWYGFNLDPTRARQMLDKLDAAFAKAGRKRDANYEIIITPPMNMAPDHVKEYAALGVHRLVVNLGSQRPEKVDQRLPEIESVVKLAA